MSERIEAMAAFVRQFPDDPFPRYALALELKKAGRGEEAVATFAELKERLPAYVPTYLQFGKLLVELGREADAKSVFEAGVERARAAKDSHALSEIEGELAQLE